jgi:hypothetical protein
MCRRRLLIGGALALLGALGFAGSARACSCAPIAPEKALRAADAAIVGELLKVLPRDRYRADFRYRVRRVYKPGGGLVRGETALVRGSLGTAACGLPQREGLRYGLLLYRSEGRWSGSSCGVLAPRRLSVAASGHARRTNASDCAS